MDISFLALKTLSRRTHWSHSTLGLRGYAVLGLYNLLIAGLQVLSQTTPGTLWAGGAWGREGNAACILRSRVNARDLLLFRREDRLCRGRKATCRTRQSHMLFGSPPKCTWLRFFLAANARVCVHFTKPRKCTGFFSFEERIGCAKAARPHAGHANPTCFLAARLNARGCVSFWRRMHGSGCSVEARRAVSGQKNNLRAFWQSA